MEPHKRFRESDFPENDTSKYGDSPDGMYVAEGGRSSKSSSFSDEPTPNSRTRAKGPQMMRQSNRLTPSLLYMDALTVGNALFPASPDIESASRTPKQRAAIRPIPMNQFMLPSPTLDTFQQRIQPLLIDLLRVQGPDEPMLPANEPKVISAAKRISAAVENKMGADAGSVFRSVLMPAIRQPDNHELRRRLLDGELAADDFVVMSELQLRSPAEVAIADAIHAHSALMHLRDTPPPQAVCHLSPRSENKLMNLTE